MVPVRFFLLSLFVLSQNQNWAHLSESMQKKTRRCPSFEACHPQIAFWWWGRTVHPMHCLAPPCNASPPGNRFPVVFLSHIFQLNGAGFHPECQIVMRCPGRGGVFSCWSLNPAKIRPILGTATCADISMFGSFQPDGPLQHGPRTKRRQSSDYRLSKYHLSILHGSFLLEHVERAAVLENGSIWDKPWRPISTECLTK